MGFMRLPGAYRSLTRPSSVLEPSHSPAGINAIIRLLTPVSVRYATYTRSHRALPGQKEHIHPSRAKLLAWCIKYGLAGIRTQGLCLAKAAIFQLIYKPLVSQRCWII